MKRLIILLLLVISVLTSCQQIGQTSISVGRILICDNGSYMLIKDNSPIVLSSENDELFDGLSTGDKVSVVHDGIAESYPAQTGAKKILLLEKGSIEDINEDVLQQLGELGWIESDKEDTRTSVKASYQYLYADMSINIFDGWEYEIEEYTEDCYSFGINFRPIGEAGWLKLHCHTGVFAVCGTGLESRNTTIGGYSVNIGTYSEDGVFSFMTFDAAGEYVVQNFATGDWVTKHETDIMSMLNTVKLSPDQLSDDDIKEIAMQQVDKEYKEIWTYFDCINGIWEVSLYNSSSDNIKIKLDSEGNLIDQEYM